MDLYDVAVEAVMTASGTDRLSRNNRFEVLNI